MAKVFPCGLHGPSIAYATTLVASGMMQSVFVFYYVKIYIDRFHVSPAWFQASQVVYMIWNAINDPLFGYFQDNFSFSWVKSRRHSILYGAPFFVISFLLTWFPWATYTKDSWLNGVQLMFVLCFYDAVFTFVLLAHCALFTEMSKQQANRIRLVKYGQVGSLIGSSSVFICESVSRHLENYNMFLVSCVIIAIFSYLFLRYSGKNAYTEYDLQNILTQETPGDTHQNKDQDVGRSNEQISVWRQTREILSHQSFISFVLMNFCQIYHVTFIANFGSIINDNLIPKDMFPTSIKSVFYGSLFFLPQIMVILGTPLVGKLGYYKIIRANFIFKIISAIVLLFCGPNPWVLMIFFLYSSCADNATFSLFNLSLSDIVDADVEKFQRKYPLSSMVFGTNALITKPAISLAPMLTVFILNRYGYEKVASTTVLPPGVSTSLHGCMFTLAWVNPLIVGLLQLLIWSRYTIRDSHLEIAKYTET